MRIKICDIPSDTKLIHAINYKKILKSSNLDLTKKESKGFIINLSHKMIKTCINDGGVGLAAPQLGIPKNLIVVREFVNQNIWDDYTEYFNVYINISIDQNNKSNLWEFNESCLSVPGASFPIKRFNEITIKYSTFDDDFNVVKKEEFLEGYLARVLLHEYDHIQGISIVDRYKKQSK